MSTKPNVTSIRGNIERFKARLMVNSFTQREGIGYIATFSPTFNKDSFRIIIALVAHYRAYTLRCIVQ